MNSEGHTMAEGEREGRHGKREGPTCIKEAGSA